MLAEVEDALDKALYSYRELIDQINKIRAMVFTYKKPIAGQLESFSRFAIEYKSLYRTIITNYRLV